MSRPVRTSDHTILIRLASTLPVGSSYRRAILAGLSSTAGSSHAASSSAYPVPLTAEQKSFLGEAIKVTNAELREQLQGSKPSYRADTSRQSEKSYAKDAFNRKSPLAGVPHARIMLDFDLAKDGQSYSVSWADFDRSGDTSSLDFLLSADGELVIVKSDTPWGRGTRSVSARQVGLEWAKDVLRKLKAQVSGRALHQKETGLLREQRVKQDAEFAEQEKLNAQRAQEKALAEQALAEKAKAEKEKAYALLSDAKAQIPEIKKQIVKKLTSKGIAGAKISYGEVFTDHVNLELSLRTENFNGSVESLKWMWSTKALNIWRFSGPIGIVAVTTPIPKLVTLLVQDIIKTDGEVQARLKQREEEEDKGKWGVWTVARDGYMMNMSDGDDDGDDDGNHSQSYISEVREFTSRAKALAYAERVAPAYLVEGTQMWNEPVGQIEESNRPGKYKLIQDSRYR
jgi:hypothetical protein